MQICSDASDEAAPASRMEPAATIIRKLGGEAVVASVTGKRLTSPYRWQAPKDRGGTNGIIPHWHHDALLDYAHRHNIELSPGDFLPQREVA